MELAVDETQREVWDILNAGPLQRFTANGCLVHNCVILDHSDNHLRLGFATDIHHPILDDGKSKPIQKRQPPLPKECSKCAYLKPAKMRTCPNCGFTPEVKPGVEEVEGDLTEMRPTGKSKEAPAGYVRIGGALISKREFFGELKFHARARGYKSGWAAQQYKGMTGKWPNNLSDAIERPVSYEVNNWIRSRLIRFAKRRDRDAGSAPAA